MRIDVLPLGERSAYDLVRAAWHFDIPDIPPPSEATFSASIRHPFPGHAWERALALLDGTPAGYLCLGLPLRDNLDNATVEIVVPPAYRRRGVGRELHGYAVSRMHALGRKRLTGET